MRSGLGRRLVPVRQVDAVWARRVAAELDRAGLPAAELLRGVGLRREQLTHPDGHIPFAAHVKLFESAARVLEDPCFGFRVGSAVELTEAGLITYVLFNSRDLGGALRNMCRYLAILTEGTVFELRQEKSETRLLFSIMEPTGVTSRQLPEFGATLLVRTCDALTGHRVRPIRIELRHDTACPMLARHLGLPVVIHQSQNALVLDASSLTVPVVDPDPRLLGILQHYCDDLLARRSHTGDLVTRVERWLLGRLHTGETDTTELAHSLGMSVRTLRRRLAERGLTPARIVDELRRDLAEQYLAGSPYSLGQITYLLGYADLATFTRAFRRWAGTTPSKWRTTRLSTTATSPPLQ